MPTYKVNLKELAGNIRNFEKFEREAILNAVEAGAMRAANLLAMKSPVDTGLYASSWSANRVGETVQLGNTAPHAGIIETGARPHFPPIGPLLAWAKRVLKDPSQAPDYSEEVQSLAWGTAKKIAEFGQQPRFIMKDNLQEVVNIIQQEVEAILNEGPKDRTIRR